MIATVAFTTVNIGLHSPLLPAAQVVNLDVDDRHGVYQLALDVILNARAVDVHYVITDYAHIYRIDPSIVESNIMSRPGTSVTRVRTLINDCILFLCQPILRVEDVREVGRDDIDSVVVPRLSSVKSGVAHWQILAMGNRTRINYHVTLEPGFFTPPLIGPHVVEKKLKDETLICFNNIERMARIRAEQQKARNATPSKRTTSEDDKAN